MVVLTAHLGRSLSCANATPEAANKRAIEDFMFMGEAKASGRIKRSAGPKLGSQTAFVKHKITGKESDGYRQRGTWSIKSLDEPPSSSTVHPTKWNLLAGSRATTEKEHGRPTSTDLSYFGESPVRRYSSDAGK